jgi:hypothetical protein
VTPETVNMLDDAQFCEMAFWAAMGFAAGWLAFFAFSAWSERRARAEARRRCFLPDRVLDENRRRVKVRRPDVRHVRYH